MKKINLFLALGLILLTLIGILGNVLWLEEPLNTNLSLPPAAPVLSRESGFYDEEFELTIFSADGADIYYTLDGSVPTEESARYEGALHIGYGGGDESEIFIPNMESDWLNGEGESHTNEATVIRAAAIDKNGVSSDIVSATFFVGSAYKENTVVSIVADPDDLFGDNGIYVTGKAYDDWYLGEQSGPAPVPNFLQHGREWERPAVLEIFDKGTCILQNPAGIRIQGASAREVADKRFSVYARKEYSGSSWFDIPLFGQKRTHAFLLRSGFMNGYIQHLVQDRDVASAESGEVIVYLNGALWYVTIMQEKYTEKYFQEYYGIPDDNVVIVKNGETNTGDAGDMALYQSIYDFINTHDLAEEEAYRLFDEIIDIQSYIDFSCVNVYFANLDYSESKNFLCWRARRTGSGEYADGRWRWALYDMDLENLDYGFADWNINTFNLDTHYAGSAFNTRPLWVALSRNEEFRKQFTVSFMDMINTDFTAERAAEALDNWTITMPWWGMKPDWTETYFPARTKAITGYLAEEMGLTGTLEELNLSVNDEKGGYLILNTITPELKDGNWSGSYFTDYPVTVTAVANQGYYFDGWQSDNPVLEDTDGKENSLTVEIPEGGFSLQAIFRKR